jgi:hypothetical protein
MPLLKLSFTLATSRPSLSGVFLLKNHKVEKSNGAMISIAVQRLH